MKPSKFRMTVLGTFGIRITDKFRKTKSGTVELRIVDLRPKIPDLKIIGSK